MMRIALFVPCYIDQFYPNVGIATLRLLESLNLTVEVPLAQVCCGQPFVNAGAVACAKPIMESFTAAYRDYEYVVCPSGSCVSMVRNHYHAAAAGSVRILELCEFLHDVIKLPAFHTRYPHRVALHQGCHGLRELQLGAASELGAHNGIAKVESLLTMIPGLELCVLTRKDECCGFGGTFAVMEPEVSCAMGRSRLEDFSNSGAEIVASTDMSCLMHLEGLIRRDKVSLRIAHVAEIFAEALA